MMVFDWKPLFMRISYVDINLFHHFLCILVYRKCIRLVARYFFSPIGHPAITDMMNYLLYFVCELHALTPEET